MIKILNKCIVINVNVKEKCNQIHPNLNIIHPVLPNLAICSHSKGLK